MGYIFFNSIFNKVYLNKKYEKNLKDSFYEKNKFLFEKFKYKNSGISIENLDYYIKSRKVKFIKSNFVKKNEKNLSELCNKVDEGLFLKDKSAKIFFYELNDSFCKNENKDEISAMYSIFVNFKEKFLKEQEKEKFKLIYFIIPGDIIFKLIQILILKFKNKFFTTY